MTERRCQRCSARQTHNGRLTENHGPRQCSGSAYKTHEWGRWLVVVR